MSHFSVLVIGDDVEKQLQPFHEFGCTGIDDEFVVDVDETEKMREEIAAGKSSWEEIKELPAGAAEFERPFKSLMEYVLYHGYEEKQFLYPGQTPTEDHKYGRVEIDASGNVAKVIRRTNPNHQWDWWEIGGRWSNMLLNNQGVKGDQFRKGDIDFAAMRTASAAEAQAEYDKMEALTKWIPLPTMTWSMAREKYNNIETARSEYNAQPWVKAVGVPYHRLGCNVEYFCVLDGGREAFVRNAEIQSFCTFAVVKDGKWYERGSMGWWGCVSDEKDDAEWQAEFANLVEGLPDDTLLTVVDCHT